MIYNLLCIHGCVGIIIVVNIVANMLAYGYLQIFGRVGKPFVIKLIKGCSNKCVMAGYWWCCQCLFGATNLLWMYHCVCQEIFV